MKYKIKKHNVKDLRGTTFKMIDQSLVPAMRETISAVFSGDEESLLLHDKSNQNLKGDISVRNIQPKAFNFCKHLYFIQSMDGKVSHYLSDLDCIILSNYQERIEQ